ncbi:MAG: tRNA pseudouridine(55) synthase TruB [Acidobacteria bacterium]|nr:tRNA pseudouridine(55) synthase TruB [Acidobacteriota bacterium]
MDAVLVIDKPSGVTSHDVVARVRRLLGERSVGHLGTLDPLATGVLPLLIGRYTRLAQFFSAGTKVYEGVIRLGFSTDTYDADGEALSPPQNIQVTLEQLRQTANEFLGEIEQQPPKFSAKKVAGVPAYKLARKNRDVELKTVQVKVHRFEVESLAGDEARFSAEVSTGTYVRSLAHDLGRRLGCGAHLAALRRTASGEFTLKDAIVLERLIAMKELAGSVQEELERLTREISVHPRRVLAELPSVTVDDQAAGLIANGRAVNLPEFSGAKLAKVFRGKDDLIAIAARVAGTLFQPKVVLQT